MSNVNGFPVCSLVFFQIKFSTWILYLQFLMSKRHFSWFMCIFLGCRNCPSPCHSLAYVMRSPYGPSLWVSGTCEGFRWVNLTVPSVLSQGHHWCSGTFPCIPHYPVKFLAIGVLWLCRFLAVTLGCCCIPLLVWLSVKWAECNSILLAEHQHPL